VIPSTETEVIDVLIGLLTLKPVGKNPTPRLTIKYDNSKYSDFALIKTYFACGCVVSLGKGDLSEYKVTFIGTKVRRQSDIYAVIQAHGRHGRARHGSGDVAGQIDGDGGCASQAREWKAQGRSTEAGAPAETASYVRT
jgi:hypothetical protein